MIEHSNNLPKNMSDVSKTNIEKNNGNALVAICMITYNQEKYIRQAIMGVLAQKTSFNITLVIGDDCSTDNTKSICEEFTTKHSNVKLLNASVNVGHMANIIRTLDACDAKYIAICEGDDYWLDPLKLQKQVDILERNTSYSLCFHNASIRFEDNSEQEKKFCTNFFDRQAFKTKHVILNDWFCPTASIIFRKDSLDKLPQWSSTVYNGDLFLQLMISLNGDLIYLDEIMSVYRKNSENSLSSINRSASFFLKKKLYLLRKFNLHTNYKYGLYIFLKIITLHFISIRSFIWRQIKTMMARRINFKY